MIKRIDKQPSPKPCPFCGSEARIRDLYDVVDWTDDDEPITERRLVCECAGVDCWVSPVTDAFDTEEEAIEAWNRRSEALEREPKSEWEHDHEILKAYSDGANGVLDELRAEIAEEKEHAYADFERYKVEYLGQDGEDDLDSLPQDDFRYGMERCIDIIDKYKAESEEQMPPERDCVNCVYSKDGHISFSETCHNCTWENQFIPKFMPKRIKASDIKPDDEWMKENEWDEIYKAESEVRVMIKENIFVAINHNDEIQWVKGSSSKTRYFRTDKYLKGAVEYHNKYHPEDMWKIKKCVILEEKLQESEE